MHKFMGVLFALACFATSAMSNSIMGAGFWFWVIIATGCIVAYSQFSPRLRGLGSGLALLLSFLSILTIVLAMVAATIGGSFKMDDSFGLLLFLFSVVAVLGFVVAILYKKSMPASARKAYEKQ